MKGFASEVAGRTGGRITARTYPNGAPGAQTDHNVDGMKVRVLSNKRSVTMVEATCGNAVPMAFGDVSQPLRA